MTSARSSAQNTHTRPPQVTAIAWLAAVSSGASVLLAIGHAGVALPVVSALGPGGDQPVPVAAAAFAVGAALFAVLARAVRGERAWSWPLGVSVYGVSLVGAAMPFRGLGSAVAIVVSLAALALLLSPAARAALLRRF